MSDVFLDYSKYYDLLYKDKNYKAESDFIISLIKEYHPNAKTILNLGCGTGQHDFYLADAGYTVTGIDLSQEMINIANNKNTSSNCRFIYGDARTLEIDSKFDIVISLFHVLSYQTTNSDILGFFSTINRLLEDDGISIFDYWYGPAVLSIKPETRVKEIDSSDMHITRHATTEMNYLANVATVNYDILIEDKKKGAKKEIHEKHPMRYFFTPEINLFLSTINLKEKCQYSWLSTSLPDEKSWSAFTIATKN
jgi:SAM-dependent methyltransferase